MTDREVAQALGQRQRLDLMGEMVGGLSHELNNALSVASGLSELLAERLADGSLSAAAAASEAFKVADWARRAATVSGQLVELSRTMRRGPRRVNLGDLARGAAELLRYRCESEGLILAVESGEPQPFVVGAPGPLQQAIANLIQNSREALARAGEGGTIRVAAGTIRVAAAVERGRARVEVEDDGPGIPPGLANRVFDPFCTTREGVPGAGLGLTVARWIAREHGGDVCFAPSGDTTLAILEIPLAHD